MSEAALSLDELADPKRARRLNRALRAHRHRSLAAPDLVALVRAAAVGAGYRPVRVPSGPGWPDATQWRNASFRVTSADPAGEALVVAPLPWNPPWADNEISPDEAAAKQLPRRRSDGIPGDPFLGESSAGYTEYKTIGQRDAVRAVLGARSGETILAVLPTGSGKTLVAQVPAFLDRNRVTVIIVPTVALALDLERRLCGGYGLEYKIAYHGSLTTEEKQGLRARLETGTQWLVVTSPEAATTALSTTLTTLATNGRLGHFVIDEAHIVAQWGGSFRPQFQALSGLLRRLRSTARTAHSDVTTVLLSGTLDDYSLDLLRHLFAEDTMAIVTAQATRPEIAYWVCPTNDDEAKREALIDAVRHLPRPLIIYTSLVDSEMGVNAHDVESWLRSAGFERIRLVTGKTSSKSKEEVIRAVRGDSDVSNDCDIVVASSAFGLGVDIDDIRCVIHACVPESIDRYYQEVGRAGRDGCASVSLLVYGPSDLDVARRLAAESSIGLEKAWLRWDAMRDGSSQDGDFRVVSLTAAHADIKNSAGTLHSHWNLHTLTLMELSGMIELDWTPPSTIDSSWSDDDIATYFETRFSDVRIRILQGDLNQVNFDHRLREARDASRIHAFDSAERVVSILSSTNECRNAQFARSYRLHFANLDIAHVETFCGGCPTCRSAGTSPTVANLHSVVPYAAGIGGTPTAQLQRFARGKQSISVTYVGDLYSNADDLKTLIRRQHNAGIRYIVSPATQVAQELLGQLASSPSRGWYAYDTVQSWLNGQSPSGLATLVILPPDLSRAEVGHALDRCNASDFVILCHEYSQVGSAHPFGLREQLPLSLSLTTSIASI